MIDVEQLSDEECYMILQKAERYATDLLLKKIEEKSDEEPNEENVTDTIRTFNFKLSGFRIPSVKTE